MRRKILAGLMLLSMTASLFSNVGYSTVNATEYENTTTTSSEAASTEVSPNSEIPTDENTTDFLEEEVFDVSEEGTPETTFSWSLDEDGLLKVSGTITKPDSGWPWSDKRTDIKNVIIEGSGEGSLSSMFYECSVLNSIDVSKFDTGNVTDMWGMFNGCKSLTILDVSNFDTSKVTDMSYMFAGCESLTELDLGKFNTSNVTTMQYMFYGCKSLTTLNVSNFNTSKVTDMSYMFGWCESLTSLTLKNFDTSKVMHVSYMFYWCQALSYLDISSFNAESICDIIISDSLSFSGVENMFSGCFALTEIKSPYNIPDNIELPVDVLWEDEDGTLVKVMHKNLEKSVTYKKTEPRENAFSVSYDSAIPVEPNDSVTLTVNASCRDGELHYQWSISTDNGYSYSTLDGETKNTLFVDHVTAGAEYCCEVRDDFGNETFAFINVTIENDLTCSGEETLITIQSGEKAVLKVNASCTEGALTYQWMKGDEIIDGDTNTLEVSPSENTDYSCRVQDKYNNRKLINFHVIIKNNPDEDYVYLICWDDDSASYYSKMIEVDPDLKDKVQIINANYGGSDNAYTQELISCAKNHKIIAAADISILDPLLLSDNFANTNEIGITEDDYKNAYSYTVRKGTYNGKLKALTPFVTTGNLIYRADIAKEVFGTSDPDEVEQLLNTPEKFLESAKKLKAAGYYAFSDNFYYDKSNPEKSSINYRVETDEEKLAANEFGKKLDENGYTHGTTMWSDQWIADMSDTSNVFAYNACTWFSGVYEGRGNFDKVNFCQGPFSYTWGGTYYLASTGCKDDEIAQKVLKDLCCDADTMEKICEYKGTMPNNRVAAQKLAAKDNALWFSLHNQNVYAFYDRITSSYDRNPSQQDTFTIAYELNGGTNHPDNPTEYKRDETITLQEPTKEGFTFGGWYMDSAFTSEAVVSVTNEDVTLYAKWKPISYTIHFDKNTAKSGSMKRVYPKYGRNYRLPASGFQKPGYTFTGWNTRKDGKGTAYKNQSNVKNLTTTSGKVVVLYAQWRKVSVSTPGKPTLGNYAAGRLTVTCKAVKGADGYLIQYSTNKNMKNAKTVSSTTLKKNIYKLKKGTTYYVRVRAYKVDSAGKKVCGKYSGVQAKKLTK